MEVLRKSVQHTLGAQHIYFPGSAGQNKYRGRAVGVEKMEERVYGLGLHESAFDVRSTAPPSRLAAHAHQPGVVADRGEEGARSLDSRPWISAISCATAPYTPIVLARRSAETVGTSPHFRQICSRGRPAALLWYTQIEELWSQGLTHRANEALLPVSLDRFARTA